MEIRIKPEINEIENKCIMEKIKKAQNWFFEKNTTIDHFCDVQSPRWPPAILSPAVCTLA